MSLELAQVLDRLHGALQKLERVVNAHEVELAEIRNTLKVIERERLNREKFLHRQIVVTREHVDVVENALRVSRSRRRS